MDWVWGFCYGFDERLKGFFIILISVIDNSDIINKLL